MKAFGRWAVLALAGVLLAGCAPKEASTSQLPAGPNVQTDWSVLANENPLPAVGERLYEQYTPELIPRDSYGPLLPFAGSMGLTLAWWEEEPAYTSPTWFYGLMTQDGTLVMDAVCSSITRCSYSQLDTATGTFSDYYLPVYALTQGDQERGRPGTGTLVALAAQDGSWWTGYRYWGVIAYPDGVAAGDQEGLTLLNAQTGETMGQYTWAQLGIEDPKAIPWFTGDAPGTAQWKDGRLFLGTYGETNQVARFLDPYTGEVSTTSAEEWFRQWDSDANTRLDWVPLAHEDGTITLTRGTQSHTFSSPLPEDEYPSVLGGDRVYFFTWDETSSRFAITDLEGNVLIPPQEGALTILDGTREGGQLLFAVPQAQDWQIYDRDGNTLYTLPGGTGSFCYLVNGLIEIVQNNCVSYYQTQTGTCIRRTYAGLPG